MKSAKEAVDEELALMPESLRRLAVLLGNEFPTYGMGGYGRSVTSREKRGLSLPTSISKSEFVQYMQIMWNATYLSDLFECQYCGFDGLESTAHYSSMQIDHMAHEKASTWNGFTVDERLIRANSLTNLATACATCNSKKSDREFDLSAEPNREHKIIAVKNRLNRTEMGRPVGRVPKKYDAELPRIREFVDQYQAVLRGRK